MIEPQSAECLAIAGRSRSVTHLHIQHGREAAVNHAFAVEGQPIGLHERVLHYFPQPYTLSHRTGRYLERHGWLVRDEDRYLQLDEADSPDHLRGHSIAYRIALGRHQGKKAFTLRTLPELPQHSDPSLAKADGIERTYRAD